MAFPTTGVLDNFNRSDGGVGSNWTRPIWFGDEGLTIASSKLVFVVSGSAADGYWNPSTFGPDSEVYLDVPTVNGAIYLFLRVADPGPSTVDGYAVTNNNGVDFRAYRLDNGTATQLGAAMTGTMASGDSFGMDAVGSTLTVYKKTGGSWSTIDTRSDGTYTAAGYLGVYSEDATDRGDNFGGGTVVSAATGSTFDVGTPTPVRQTVPGTPTFSPLLPSGVEQNAIGYQTPLPITRYPSPKALLPHLPGFSILLPTGVDQNQIGYVTPLPISQYVNPLSLVLGPTILPFPQPYYPVAANDITITLTTAGNLVLSADVATPKVSATPTVGDLVLSAGTQTPKVSTTPSVGNLVLSAGTNAPQVSAAPSAGNLVLSAGSHTLAFQVTPAVGNLVLSAGTHLPAVSTTPTVGNLTLSGAAAVMTVVAAPSAGNLILSADAPTITGGTPVTSAVTPQDPAQIIAQM